jgi:hypothetical protein
MHRFLGKSLDSNTGKSVANGPQLQATPMFAPMLSPQRQKSKRGRKSNAERAAKKARLGEMREKAVARINASQSTDIARGSMDTVSPDLPVAAVSHELVQSAVTTVTLNGLFQLHYLSLAVVPLTLPLDLCRPNMACNHFMRIAALISINQWFG